MHWKINLLIARKLTYEVQLRIDNEICKMMIQKIDLD